MNDGRSAEQAGIGDRSTASPLLSGREAAERPNLADVVALHLRFGTPITIGELAESLKVSRRVVEASIEELRRRGRPICSGSQGVWLTQDGDELLEQYRALRRRALHQLANLRAMQRTARAMKGVVQETLWDVA